MNVGFFEAIGLSVSQKGGAMQSAKISCTHCLHHARCSQKTRMYVNYCGADQKRINDHIRAAIMECRSLKGRLFIREINMIPAAKNIFQHTLSAAPA